MTMQQKLCCDSYSLMVCLVMLFACGQVAGNSEKKRQGKINHVTKPGSSFEDSLKISTAAAVFFEPDSLQLQKIKSVTEEGVFKGSMHEYRYQTKNAHAFLKTHWPKLKILDARNVRYL